MVNLVAPVLFPVALHYQLCTALVERDIQRPGDRFLASLDAARLK
jgi:hypothetical protein